MKETETPSTETGTPEAGSSDVERRVMSPLVWTVDVPTADGWYWYRPASWDAEDAIVVQVCDGVWYDHEPADSYGTHDLLREKPLTRAHGLWAGPIPPPVEAA